jgi:16S rRNA (adenine1518-N6/adenine1519-N6)-dimethyltransferase
VDGQGLLRQYGIRPSKGLGQNFLVAGWAFDRIIEASELTARDHVLEVGPGLGTLTRRLAQAAGRVTAVELDARMVAILRETLAGFGNVDIREGDILAMRPEALVEPSEVAEGRYKVVANLPYYITSRVLRHLLDAPVRPVLLTLMVQQEVGERIIAGPGDMSILAVSVQAFGQPNPVCTVPPSAFYPSPQVASMVLSIRTHETPLVPESLRGPFFQVVHAGVQQKRKQLHNSLTANLSMPVDDVTLALANAGIDARARPQTLDVAGWLRLTRALYPRAEG